LIVLSELTVKRCDHGSGTNTKTSDEATDEDGGDFARRSCLHDRANGGHDSGQDEVVSTSNLISDESSAQSSDEAAALQGGDDVGLEIREWYTDQSGETVGAALLVSTCIAVNSPRGDLLLECLHGQNASDDARVHAEQHAAEACLGMSVSSSDASWVVIHTEHARAYTRHP
jgi:hypothetical protein